MATAHRCGWVALMGPPNAGKSTLTNALVGQKVAIVTAKPQTTRNRIVGILTQKDAQVIFMDTPGVHALRGQTRGQLGKIMVQSAWQSFAVANCIVLVIDGDLYLRKPDFMERDLAPLIHTVDNLKFAETLARRLPEGIPVQRVLLQVNIGNEPQKAGVDEHDLPALAEAVLALPRLEVRGLMCLPPFFDDGEAARPYFARLRELRDDLEARLGIKLPELSMGMSGDCVQAVEEGATLVRVGTDIFGPRPVKA